MKGKNAMLYALWFAGMAGLFVHLQLYGLATFVGLACLLAVLSTRTARF